MLSPAIPMIFENRKSVLSIYSEFITSKIFHINNCWFAKALTLSLN
jgi:hypothetical protein